MIGSFCDRRMRSMLRQGFENVSSSLARKDAFHGIYKTFAGKITLVEMVISALFHPHFVNFKVRHLLSPVPAPLTVTPATGSF